MVRRNRPCVVEVCGDGITQTGEVCNDGNTVDNAGCSATRMKEFRSDGT